MEYIIRIFVEPQYDLMAVGMEEVEKLLQDEDIFFTVLEIEEA